MDLVEKNILDIKKRIRNACERVGKNPEDVYLIAVSKNFSAEVVQRAVDQGIKILGENRVQEAQAKQPLIEGDVKWHLIGHLQRNKVRHAVKLFSMIQSVDSERLAKEISRRAGQIEKNIDVLIQINIGQEESKYGINPDEVEEFIRKISQLQNLNIKGLMAIAPYKENPEDVRPYFRQMYDIFENIQKLSIDNIEMKYLSMGMSNDFEVAIEEGANMIRVGTSVFGARNY